jgi:hypothetical protein
MHVTTWIAVALAVAACSATEKGFSGLLGDYSQLKVGDENQAHAPSRVLSR